MQVIVTFSSALRVSSRVPELVGPHGGLPISMCWTPRSPRSRSSLASVVRGANPLTRGRVAAAGSTEAPPTRGAERPPSAHQLAPPRTGEGLPFSSAARLYGLAWSGSCALDGARLQEVTSCRQAPALPLHLRSPQAPPTRGEPSMAPARREFSPHRSYHRSKLEVPLTGARTLPSRAKTGRF